MIFNNSLIPGNFPVPLDGLAGQAASLAYDNRSGEIYVASFADSISVISEATNEVVDLFEPFDTIQYLTSIVYDYKDNEIFTQYTGSPGTVAVTSAATNTLVATVTVGDVSEYNINGLTYDSGLGEVFASNGLSSNVSVISTATDKVVDSVYLYDQIPQALAYDSGTQQIFAANVGFGNNVSVISDASNTLVKSIAVGTYPDAIAYDSGNGHVYVANFNSANVSVINDTTDTVLTAISVALAPKAAAYDPARNEVFVTCGNSNESVVSDVSNTVVATVPLESGTNGAAYDPDQGEVWVIDGYPTNASAISDTSKTVVENVLLTFSSRYWAYDSAHQEEFLADTTSSTVAVVSDTTDHVVAMVRIPGEAEPYRLVYDSGKGEVFTSDNAGGYGLSVINDTTDAWVKTIPLPGIEPTGMTYDPAKGEIFVGNSPGNNVTIISDTTDSVVGVIPNVGNDPWSLVYDSGKGEIFVANQGTGVSGTNVTVINDTTDTIVTSVNIGTNPLGEIVYDSGKGEIFVPNYGSDNVSVISDATNKVVATIFTGTFAWGAAYDPTANEIFVGDFNGDFENVTVISDVTDTTVGSIFPDAFDPSSLAFDPVTGDLYSGDSTDGTLAVITPESGSSYTVTFQAVPTSCSITFDGVAYTNGQQVSGVTAGSYPLVAPVCSGETFSSWSSTAGSVTSTTSASTTVAVSATGTITATFTATSPGTYTITFQTVPTSCSITFNGLSYTSGQQASGVAAGSYPLVAPVCSGETLSSWSSTAGTVASPASVSTTITVSSTGTVTATFGATPPGTYLVTFIASGLPMRTSWSVTFSGTLLTTTNLSEAVARANGSYPFTVNAVTDYTANVTGGTVVVSGFDRVVEIGFAAATTPPPVTGSGGFFSGSNLYILLGLLLLGLLIVILFLVYRRRPPLVFEQSGLPLGARWSVTFNGLLESSTGTEISFRASNGTYPFTVGPVPAYVGTPESGSVEVTRRRRVVSVAFASRKPPH